MDQILHRKLIIEKNNLQLEVAKANKEVAKLMETVQQYEAVLASLNEAEGKKLKSSIGSISKSSTIKIHPSVKPGFEKDGLEPNNVSGLKAKKLEPDFRPQPKQKPGKYERPAWLRSTEHHDAYFDPETNHVDTINTATGVRKWVHVDDLALTHPLNARGHQFEDPKTKSTKKPDFRPQPKQKPGKYERPAWLRSTEHHDAYFDPETNHVDTINTATGVRKWVHVDDLALTLPPRLRAMHEFEKPKLSTNTKVGVKLPAKNKSINKTLVRGADAIKLKAASGKKLPTAAEAKKQMKQIKANKELERAGLGKLKKSRLSIMNRLDKGKELGEYGSAKERADNANLARLQRKSGIDLDIRGTHRESGGSVTPAGEGAEQRRMRQQEKTIQKFGN